MTDDHKDETNTHGNIGKLVQIGKEDGSITIQDTLETYASCPVCNRNDKVEKVSAILTNQPSVLAMKLRAPAQPQAKRKPSSAGWLRYVVGFVALLSTFGLICSCLMILFVLFMVFTGKESQLQDSDFQIFLEFIIAPVFIMWFLALNKRYQKENDEYNQELKRVQEQEFPKWKEAMKRWEKLYYCYRDACLFIPGENTYAEADSINEYVYYKI